MTDPARSVIVTVWVDPATTRVGVPEITPVAGSILNPAGRAGLTAKLAGPVRATPVGASVVTGAPTVPDRAP